MHCTALCSGFAPCTAVSGKHTVNTTLNNKSILYTVPESINYAHYSVLSLLPLSLQCSVSAVPDSLSTLSWTGYPRCHDECAARPAKKPFPSQKIARLSQEKVYCLRLDLGQRWLVIQRRKWRQSDGMQPTMYQSETFQDRESFMANFE